MDGEPDFLDTDLPDAGVAERSLSNGQAGVEVVPPEVGDYIGKDDRFQLIRTLGAGSMGQVFQALDRELSRYTAVKVITPHARLPPGQMADLLKNEARAIAKLNHANIVQIYDMGTWRGLPFLVMEFLRGETLLARVKREPLSPVAAIDILIQVAQGLSHAHQNQLIHRDLKPGNVFVLHDQSVKLLDFGLVHRVEQFSVQAGLGPFFEDNETRDPVPKIAGTPAFMAPEQWQGGDQDARTDIWAAGILLYFMLAGELPYTNLTAQELRDWIMSSPGSPLAKAPLANVPEPVSDIIERAVRKVPDERLQSAGELLALLESVRRDLAVAGAGAAQPEQPRAEQRQLTLLACSLRVPEGEDRMSLEEVGQLARSFHYVCESVCKRTGGQIISEVGTQILAGFGCSIAHEDDAQYAVQAALEIRDTAARLGQSPEFTTAVQVGVSTGRVLVEKSALSPSGQLVIRGATPDVAVRLKDLAGPGVVYICPHTYRLVSGLFAMRQVQGAPTIYESWTTVKDAYEVLHPLEVQSRFEGASQRVASPLISRKNEMTRLLSLWRRASAGSGQFVMLEGEAGIGKSRLGRTIKEQVLEQGGECITLQGWQQYENTAFYPLTVAIRRFMDISSQTASAQQAHKLEDRLSSLGLALDEYVPLCMSLLSMHVPERYPAMELAPAVRKQRTIDAIVSLLCRLAGQTPLLVWVEDVHWIDPSTRDFLTALERRVSSAPLMALLTFRPELEAPWSEAAHVHCISLARLGRRDTETMIRQLTGYTRLPDDVVSRIAERTDGIPLYVEEFSKMVSAALGSRKSATGTEPILENDVIPETLHHLVAAKLDRLSSRAQTLARLASVLDRDFSMALVQELFQSNASHTPGALKELTDAGILTHLDKAESQRYVFSHALIRQAIYQSMVRQTRSSYHLRVASTLSKLAARSPIEPEQLAHHYERAGYVQSALDYWDMAGERAVKRSALVEAINHFRHALRLVSELPRSLQRDEREFALLMSIGPSLMAVKGYAHQDIQEVYSRAQELCTQRGDQEKLFSALHGLWQYQMVGGRLPEARALGERLAEVAGKVNDAKLCLLAHRALGTTLFLQGEPEACRQHTLQALHNYHIEEHRGLGVQYGHDPGVAAGLYLAWSLCLLGDFDEALARVRAAEALAIEIAHPMTIAFAKCYVGIVCNHRGDFADAVAVTQEALDLALDKSFSLWVAMGRIQQGWALSELGDTERGIKTLTQGIDAWCKTGALGGTTLFYVVLADALRRAGQYEDAGAALDESARMAKLNDEHCYDAEICRVRGAIARDNDPIDSSRPETLYRHGLQIARRQTARGLELRLALNLFELLDAENRGNEGHEILTDIVTRFPDALVTRDLKTARALLARP